MKTYKDLKEAKMDMSDKLLARIRNTVASMTGITMTNEAILIVLYIYFKEIEKGV